MRRNTTWETNDLLSDSEQLHKLTRLRLKWTTFHSSSQTVYEDDFQSPSISRLTSATSARHRLWSFPPYQVTTDVRLSNRFFHRLHANSAVGHRVDTMSLTQTLHVERMEIYGDEMIWQTSNMIKLDQTWSNMTCWDMFFCQTCFHTVCISFIFHSYYIYLVHFSSNLLFFQSYSVSPFRPWRRLHSKSCTKWPAFEANWICDNHLSPLDLRWCGCLAIRSAKSGLNPNQKPHFHKFHQISSISDVISYHVLNI